MRGMSKTSTTAIACRREELNDVKELAVQLSKEQGRTVPLWEAVRVLLDSYQPPVPASSQVEE
jgi:hypothetical protein